MASKMVLLLLGLSVLLIFCGAYLNGRFKSTTRPILQRKITQGLILLILGVGYFTYVCHTGNRPGGALDRLTFLIEGIAGAGSFLKTLIRSHSRTIIRLVLFLCPLLAGLNWGLNRAEGKNLSWLLLLLPLAIGGQALLLSRMFLPAIGVYLALAAGTILYSSKNPEAPPPHSAGFPFPAAIGCILVVLALVVYFYHIDRWPYQFNDYEASNGLSALQIAGGDRDHTRAIWGYYERAYADSAASPFFVLPLIPLFRVWGVSLTVLRSLGVFWGLAALILFYLWLKNSFGRSPALIGAALMMISPWYLNIARRGIYTSLSLFYALLCFFLCFEVLRTGRVLFYLILGFILGFYGYFYVPVKIVPPLIVLLWLHQAALRKGFCKKHLFGFILMWVVFAILIIQQGRLDAYLTGFRVKGPFIWELPGKANFDPVLGGKNLLINLKHIFHNLLFSNTGSYTYTPQGPLINGAIFALAAWGLAFSLARLKEGKYFFCVLWLFFTFATILPIHPQVDRAVPRRSILLIPLIFTLTSIPLARFLEASRRKRERTASRALLAALFLIFLTLNLHVYFQLPINEDFWYRDEKGLGNYIKQQLEEYDFLFVIKKPELYLSARVIDFINYPLVNKLYYRIDGLRYSRTLGPFGDNPRYRYVPAGDLEKVLSGLSTGEGKKALIIAQSPRNDGLISRIKEIDPQARIELLRDRLGFKIGYFYDPGGRGMTKE